MDPPSPAWRIAGSPGPRRVLAGSGATTAAIRREFADADADASLTVTAASLLDPSHPPTRATSSRSKATP